MLNLGKLPIPHSIKTRKEYMKPLPIIALLIMVLVTSACGPGQLFGPTLTPTITLTPTQTATLTPTATPCPVSRIVFEYPSNGQTLDFEGAYQFKVVPYVCAQNYLWGFFQNGTMVWENLRDEGTLSSNEYGIQEGTTAHAVFVPGPLTVMVRYMLPDGQFSDATEITLVLKPR